MVAEELRPTAWKALRSAMTIVWVTVGRLMASNLRPRGVAVSSRRVEKVVGYTRRPAASQPPGPAPDAAVGSEPTRTAARQAKRTWVRRNERSFETKEVSVTRFLSIWNTGRERKR
jgi:hypothetical protein